MIIHFLAIVGLSIVALWVLLCATGLVMGLIRASAMEPPAPTFKPETQLWMRHCAKVAAHRRAS